MQVTDAAGMCYTANTHVTLHEFPGGLSGQTITGDTSSARGNKVITDTSALFWHFQDLGM